MKKLLRKHPDALLITLAIIFLAALIAAFVFGINNVVGQVNRAESANPGPGDNGGFNLQAAQSLDLRGLVNQSSSAL